MEVGTVSKEQKDANLNYKEVSFNNKKLSPIMLKGPRNSQSLQALHKVIKFRYSAEFIIKAKNHSRDK